MAINNHYCSREVQNNIVETIFCNAADVLKTQEEIESYVDIDK